MIADKPKILYVSDLYYKARQRSYHEEDIFVTSRLRDHFHIVICHPKDTEPFEELVDVIVFRNTGPVIYYAEEYESLKLRLAANQYKVYNSLTGKADMRGKQYLVDLTKAGFPVIPTVDTKDDMNLLPASNGYVVKPRDGADSIGMEFIRSDEAEKVIFNNTLLQPRIDFLYEISFYFIDHEFQYALFAPDKNKRWKLEQYAASDDDLTFARRFIEWNSIDHGIQRVDACLTRQGTLLLVELEDFNPYLSLLDVDAQLQDKFISTFKSSLSRILANSD